VQSGDIYLLLEIEKYKLCPQGYKHVILQFVEIMVINIRLARMALFFHNVGV
jgi:hypothetical protein